MADHLEPNRRATVQPRVGGQRGSSLLEVLIAVMLLSGLGVALMSGFFTTSAVAGSTDERSDAQAALSNVLERLSVMPYHDCATAADLQTDYRAWPDAIQPDGYDVTVLSVGYLAGQGLDYGSTCGPDRGAQLVTVSVVATRGSATVTGDVVLRDPEARAR